MTSRPPPARKRIPSNLTIGPQIQIDAELEHRALTGLVSFADLRRADAVYRGIYHPYPLRTSDGAKLALVVAITKAPVSRSLNALLAILALALFAGGATAAWGAARIARRLTLPLERIADSARGVHEENLAARLPDVSPDAELRDVVAILNDMLARLDAAFAAQRQLVNVQRRFVADASHELRSPLANLRGTVEVALRRSRSEAEYRETLTTALVEIERLSRLAGNLLTLPAK